MSDWESVFTKEVYFIFLALVLAFGILQTTGTVLDTERPVVSVVSCSMYPEYDRGDVLVLRGVEFDEISEGEVIVFEVPREITVTINDETFRLTEENSDTPLGQAKVTSVEGNNAVIEINGNRVNVMNGASYTVNGEDLRVNEISGMDIPVVHRVVEKRNDSLETMGDANPGQLDFEQDIRPEQVHGRIFFRIPKVGAVKLVAMDLVGLTGDPLSIDTYSSCQ